MLKRLLLATALLFSACGPTLTVQHQDPTYSQVNVWVGDELVGELEYGEDLSVRLDQGVHTVRAVPFGETENPWVEDGESWRFVLDEEAVITLLPPTDEWP